MFSRYLIQRDFHDILHKFQSLGGAEASAEQDELEIKLQGGDLKEAGNGGIDNTNVDVENAVGDFFCQHLPTFAHNMSSNGDCEAKGSLQNGNAFQKKAISKADSSNTI